MTDIIERLEAPTGPDRELDREIATIVGEGGRLPDWDWRPEDDCPRYTAYIDAALTLVPEGWEWNVTSDNIATVCKDWDDDKAPVYWSQDSKTLDWMSAVGKRVSWSAAKGTVATPALALCIAAMKARRDGG